MSSNLQVRILSSREDVFSGEAIAVSSVNTKGTFDILPGHAKFVTVVEGKPIVLRLANGSKQEFSFSLAIIRVKEDKVDIFINPTEAGQEINSQI